MTDLPHRGHLPLRLHPSKPCFSGAKCQPIILHPMDSGNHLLQNTANTIALKNIIKMSIITSTTSIIFSCLLYSELGTGIEPVVQSYQDCVLPVKLSKHRRYFDWHRTNLLPLRSYVTIFKVDLNHNCPHAGVLPIKLQVTLLC